MEPQSTGFFLLLMGTFCVLFVPGDDRLGSPPRTVNPFGADAARRALNTPMRRVRTLPVNQPIPQFWLAAGGAFREDVAAARAFQRRLLDRQPDVTVHLAPGGKHNMATWRALVPPLLEWMTPRLAYAPRRPVPLAPCRSRPAPGPGPRAAAGRPAIPFCVA